MNEPSRRRGSELDPDRLSRKIGRRAKRKQQAREQKPGPAWFGLGMFGLVGWSIAIPTLIGIAVGVWADKRWPGEVSWTLTLLFIGLALGCANAWYWIKQESHRD
ncbi:AtpZ/AtpI family protein [Marinobacter koreensis]|uniref:AtpZ/AtpI family protein n=1 Tax=Marinobacter koreensis TaxID=335974 RepID=A0ABW0RFU9_9GAMM|nr:AtpZ/AtpI family protein [Marinobacter koreensis]MCK7548122.1 AtpZ/AtpI family protein [Marinobacter koreensis]MDX1816323.1 AtpZ/AtpI family protein [Marinobacter sp.]